MYSTRHGMWGIDPSRQKWIGLIWSLSWQGFALRAHYLRYVNQVNPTHTFMCQRPLEHEFILIILVLNEGQCQEGLLCTPKIKEQTHRTRTTDSNTRKIITNRIPVSSKAILFTIRVFIKYKQQIFCSICRI